MATEEDPTWKEYDEWVTAQANGAGPEVYVGDAIVDIECRLRGAWLLARAMFGDAARPEHAIALLPQIETVRQQWETARQEADALRRGDVAPMVDAVRQVAEAISGLLYGLKYSKAEGMSVAEAIECAGDRVAAAVREGADALADSVPSAEPSAR